MKKNTHQPRLRHGAKSLPLVFSLAIIIGAFLTPFHLARAFTLQAQSSGRPSAVQNIATSKVRGIKILSSSYDLATHAIQISFINDSSADIIQFHGRLIRTRMNGNTSEEPLNRVFVDPFTDAIDKKMRPWLPEKASFHAIHPGETYVQDMLVVDQSPGENTESSVSAVYDVVVYANGTAQVANDRAFQEIVEGRKNAARTEGEIAQIGKEILLSSSNNLLSAMANALEGRGMSGDLWELRHPEAPGTAINTIIRTKTRDGKYDEREILKEYISAHEDASKFWNKAANVKVVTQ
jgi:hypothetical protein